MYTPPPSCGSLYNLIPRPLLISRPSSSYLLHCSSSVPVQVSEGCQNSRLVDTAAKILMETVSSTVRSYQYKAVLRCTCTCLRPVYTTYTLTEPALFHASPTISFYQETIQRLPLKRNCWRCMK